MACFRPLGAFLGPFGENGKRQIVWKEKQSDGGVRLNLPCGRCVGCKMDRARSWAVRCLFEASLHKENSFVTLTYDNAHLPADGSLRVADFQGFMKRLRSRVKRRIRFFHSGEYGGKLGRPHYHALLFGYDFPDKVLHSVRRGRRLFVSKLLSDVWPFGYSSCAAVEYGSAAYVARYATKKVYGSGSSDHYGSLKPEYCTMSRRPGIAAEWFNRFRSDVYPSDFLVVEGRRVKPPKYFDRLLERVDADLLEELKARRVKFGRKFFPLDVNGLRVLVSDNDSFRLPVKESVLESKLKVYVRGFNSPEVL